MYISSLTQNFLCVFLIEEDVMEKPDILRYFLSLTSAST
jgi:hypothetical protein